MTLGQKRNAGTESAVINCVVTIQAINSVITSASGEKVFVIVAGDRVIIDSADDIVEVLNVEGKGPNTWCADVNCQQLLGEVNDK